MNRVDADLLGIEQTRDFVPAFDALVCEKSVWKETLMLLNGE